MTAPRWCCSLLLVIGAACADDAEGSNDTSADSSGSTSSNEATADSGEMMGSSSSGGPSSLAIDLPFVAVFGEQPAACGVEYADMGTGDDLVELVDARLYLSNLRVVDDEGNETPIALTVDDVWQSATTVLLDFEDASGACTAGNTAAMNDRVVGTVPMGTYTGLRFEVGVPADENHLDVNVADPPLNVSPLFWNWRNGYKFMRIDLSLVGSGGWNFHLGSTGPGCTSNDGPATDPPSTPCGRASRPTIDLALDPTSDAVQVDLAPIFAGVDLSAPPDPETMNPLGCQSFDFQAADNACEAPFAALGLDIATGNCEANCDGQLVFSALRN